MKTANDKIRTATNTPVGDWVLGNLVNMAKKNSMSFDVTLNVGGILVSGSVVGEREYLHGLREQLAAAFPDEDVVETMARILRVPEVDEKWRSQVDLTHVHLKRAKFFVPSSGLVPRDEGVSWRGRIDAVQGFVMGRLGA